MRRGCGPRSRRSARSAAIAASGSTCGRKCGPAILDNYYTPGTPLAGRCLYPFLTARVSFSGKAYFCPFIRVEVGDLTTQSLEEIWTGEKYVSLRKTLLEEGLFPVCRRCCKVELSPEPVAATRRRRQPTPCWRRRERTDAG